MILVILAAFLWYVLMSRAINVLLLPAVRRWMEVRAYEWRARSAETATVIDLPTRSPDRRAA